MNAVCEAVLHDFGEELQQQPLLLRLCGRLFEHASCRPPVGARFALARQTLRSRRACEPASCTNGKLGTWVCLPSQPPIARCCATVGWDSRSTPFRAPPTSWPARMCCGGAGLGHPRWHSRRLVSAASSTTDRCLPEPNWFTMGRWWRWRPRSHSCGGADRYAGPQPLLSSPVRPRSWSTSSPVPARRCAVRAACSRATRRGMSSRRSPSPCGSRPGKGRVDPPSLTLLAGPPSNLLRGHVGQRVNHGRGAAAARGPRSKTPTHRRCGLVHRAMLQRRPVLRDRLPMSPAITAPQATTLTVPASSRKRLGDSDGLPSAPSASSPPNRSANATADSSFHRYGCTTTPWFVAASTVMARPRSAPCGTPRSMLFRCRLVTRAHHSRRSWD